MVMALLDVKAADFCSLVNLAQKLDPAPDGD
jgi:hypothetical protein